MRLDRHHGHLRLHEISRVLLQGSANEIGAKSSGATPNRDMALVRAILRKVVNDRQWIDRVPRVHVFREVRNAFGG